MDGLLVFKVKEEIISSVLGKHRHILLTGWKKTGKTTSLVRATCQFSKRFYFSPNQKSLSYVKGIDEDINVIDSLSELPPETDVILIVDDFSNLDASTRKSVERFIRDNNTVKIVVVTNKIIDLKQALLLFDAVVRFKNDTAEILYSSLLDKNLLEDKH